MSDAKALPTPHIVEIGEQAIPEAALKVAAEFAGEVDHVGRFPSETFWVLRDYGLLGALVPKSCGGHGASLGRVAADCQALGAACSASGMILAMHHVQVACLARHALGAPWHTALLRRVARDQLLLASSTSEVDIGGALRTSGCAIVRQKNRFEVVKRASAISYAKDADAILVTARAHQDAASGDQALAVVERNGLTLEPQNEWDAMGMRGTGTGAFILTGKGAMEQILATPFADIAACTMVPISHILWSAVWTGIAGDAVARARAFLRKKPPAADGSLPHGALALAEAVEQLQLAEARIKMAITAFDWQTPVSPNFASAAADNGLKTGVSEVCLAVTQQAMAVCGFAGFARKGPFSVSRHLRDLHSAPLMIANSRMRESAARLLLAQKPLLGLD